jgi:hypothetical protein
MRVDSQQSRVESHSLRTGIVPTINLSAYKRASLRSA